MSSPWSVPGSEPASSQEPASSEWGAPAPGASSGSTNPRGGADPLHRELVERVPIFPLRPLGLGEILGAAVRIYRVRPKQVFGLAAIVFGITFALTSGFTGVGLIPTMTDLQTLTADPLDSPDTSMSLSEIYVMVITNVATGLVTLVAIQLVTLALSRLTLDEALRHDATSPAISGILRRRGLSAVLLGLGTSIIAAIPILVLPLLAGIPLLVVREAHWWTIGPVVLGIVLGLLGTLYLTLRCMLATPEIASEEVGPLTALRRSFALTRGRRFWRTAGIGILLYVLYSTAQGLIAGVLGSVAMVIYVGILLASGFTALIPAMIVMLVLSFLGTYLGVVATAPFWSAGIAALYADVRMRHEAWDVELLGVAQRAGVPE